MSEEEFKIFMLKLANNFTDESSSLVKESTSALLSGNKDEAIRLYNNMLIMDSISRAIYKACKDEKGAGDGT